MHARFCVEEGSQDGSLCKSRFLAFQSLEAVCRMVFFGVGPRCGSANTVLLSVGAGYSVSNLKPGVATLPAVMASKGDPVMRCKKLRWTPATGLSARPGRYPDLHGVHRCGWRLEPIESVMDREHLARIEPGKSDQSSVLRLLGPSAPLRTQYRRLSIELAWEWRFSDGGSRLAFLKSYSARVSVRCARPTRGLMPWGGITRHPSVATDD